ncbi:CRISPR-associated protein Cas5 [Candidatus Acidianus copahuensis]|uniref:CRISPR-associated protein Cas5 n=1 Tax=Candidatus Acidianus copahuensis TaxID=1160895 RepID=A0A031LIY9_9CREN|nr:type I-A CRISPR-associated protein Cas5a [Candidatus Acidianus copahuensis]EZQ01516.1 CRISPR-associated protein Cas5 [Candidatus Acidianus copahuensis]
MIGLIFDVEFMWGFQARVAGMSKSSPSFSFPPPTVILGALAEPVARRLKAGEGNYVNTIAKLSKSLLALGIKSLNFIPLKYQDLNRVLALRTSDNVRYPSPNPGEVYASFDAPARGKTSTSSIDGRPPTLRVFMVFKDDIVKVEDIWKIKRIGSKESLVSVIDVVSGEPTVIRGDIETDYSYPISNAIQVIDTDGTWISEHFVSPFDLSDSPAVLYSKGLGVQYNIGLPFRDLSVKLRLNGWVGYKLNNEVVVGRNV